MDGAVPSEIAENNLAYAEKSAENESENAKIAKSKNARSISGDFESGRGLSERSARTAFPSINESSLYYKVTATSGGKTVEGEVNGNSFTIKLSSGNWTVKAEGYSDSTMNTKILEGSTPVTLNANTVDNNISITLSPISSGSGKIDLTVNFESTTGINNVEMTLTKGGGTPITISGSGSSPVRLNRTNIPAGVYNAEINFKSSSGELKYSTHETVNVFSNLTTNTWQGNAPYLSGTGTNKKFEITQNLVNTFSRKEFYVQGAGGTYNPPTNASDTNSGTYFDPFKTIQQAVDIINDINDGTSAYTIKVDGTLTQTSATTYQNPDSFVNISSTKTLNLIIEGLTSGTNSNGATIDANINRPEGGVGTGGNGRVFCIGENSNETINVTLKNLTLKGGYYNSINVSGAGIYLEKGNLTLSSVTVTDNICGNGGGIYIKSGTCNINGGTISNNNAVNGSGIYVAGGTLKISGTTTMSGNKNTSTRLSGNGTAIFVGKGATAELNGSSGTISITPAQGDAHPTIYLEKGQQGSLSSGGSGGSSPILDAVLKLSGAVKIGNDNGTGIKIEGKADETKTNIKITSRLTSTQTINISYDDAKSGEAIIEGENYTLTENDCKKFSFDNSAFSLLLLNGKGIIF